MNAGGSEGAAQWRNICPICGSRMEEGNLQYIGYSPSAIRWFRITPGSSPGAEAVRDPDPEDLSRKYIFFTNVNWAALRCRKCKMLMAWY